MGCPKKTKKEKRGRKSKKKKKNDIEFRFYRFESNL